MSICYIIFWNYFLPGSASCYFSIELQGSFVTQGTVANHEIQYSQVNITEDSIPIWGVCQKRIENNVILMISSEETTCFRCFNLKLVSRNVLRARTTDSDYISKCYANEEKAIASCPTEEILKDSSLFTEIILYSKFSLIWNSLRALKHSQLFQNTMMLVAKKSDESIAQ